MKLLKTFYKLIIFTLIFCLCSCSSNQDTLVDLGAPTKEYYPYNYIARCVWDMEIVDNKLYIGCGDYNKNSGKTPLLYYDLSSGNEWQCETWINDEQIGRFLNLDGKMTIPGFDPLGLPETGTYYQKENDSWITVSGLPDGLHNYDLIRFDNKIFCGIGANRGATPIAYTEDNINYFRVPMIKNGTEIDTNGGDCIRTHNFYVLNNILYAELWYENIDENKLVSEIYKYENEQFVFHSELTGKLNTSLACRNLPPVICKKNFNDCIFTTTGLLYYTNDLENFTKINLPNYANTYDIYEFDGRLYLLTATESGQDYITTIYSTTSENFDDFIVEATFNSPVHPTSFAINKDNFYVALGKWWHNGSEDNGKIIKIRRG